MSHQMKMYVFFALLGMVFLGILTYLYFPFGIHFSENLSSNALQNQDIPSVISSEVVVPIETHDDESLSVRRIRLTNLLLKHQRELLDLENQGGDLSERQEAINTLRIKIDNLSQMIRGLVPEKQ